MNRYLKIEDIENSNNKTVHFKFNDKVEGIDCVTPIKAELEAKSLGEFIEIKGHVSGVVYLECDLCLNKFKYNMDFDIDELFCKNSLIEPDTMKGKEYEIKDGEFVTDLNGADEIDICDLLYQSVILNFPNKKVCGINCKGKDYLQQDDNYDPRLDVFNIQINPKE